MNPPGVGGADTRDEELLADLFDTLLQDILEGRTPDLEALQRDRPDLRDRIAKTWQLACSVAGRREPSRPVLGGYEIVRELGHGGMGTVYLARHQTLQRDVAIKVLPHSLAMSPRAKQRFLEEARALAQIRHDNVVHIHRIVDHAEMLAFEMEFVDGPSLQTLIVQLAQRQKPMALASLIEVLGHDVDAGVRSGVEWFVRLGIRIARALAEVHRHGLVHRDVKPSNILLRRDGTPVLADFGLALQGDLDATRTKFAGTPVYAAPERLRGSTDAIDGRTDVYSLGVTLYEVLTSSPPFAGSSTHEVLRRIENGAAPPLRSRAPHVPRDLAIVIAKAMEPDARHRYATADEFADDLERLLSLQPIHARPAGVMRRAWQFVRRHQRPVMAALASAALAAGAIWPLSAHAAAEERARARAAAAMHVARTTLLCPETLPSSWSLRRETGLELRQSSAEAARARALARSLEHYEQALAEAPLDADLRRERDVVAAAARLHTADDKAGDAGSNALPPLCRALARNAASHRRLTEGLDDAVRTAADPDRAAAGLFAFLCGDYGGSSRCWQDLPAALREDALLDACLALQIADEGEPERAYPRLFHAARAFPDATAVAVALADAAVATGDLPLARQWLAKLRAASDPATEARCKLLAADLLAAEGDWEQASVQYRRLLLDDASNPAPLQRLAEAALQTGRRDSAKGMLATLLARWPYLGQARRHLARLALQEHDLSGYLAHARLALAQLRSENAPIAADLGDVLRLGGLQAALAATPYEARERHGRHRDDAIPLSSWMHPGSVAAILQGLRVFARLDAVAEQAATLDARPMGIALRTTWLGALQLPGLTLQLPTSLQVALLVGLPQAFGEGAQWLGELMAPYQRTLGVRLHQTAPRELFTRAQDDGIAIFGAQIVDAADVDGDTRADLVFASPPTASAPDAGCIEVRSAQDGQLLRTWQHPDANAMFGRSLASLGDVDGDLCTDLLIGLPAATRSPDAIGAVELWSGRRGAPIWRLEDGSLSFGVAVAAIADIDGDGVRDFVAGRSPLDLANDIGSAVIGSGRTGAVLRTVESERDGVWFGGAVANAGDVSGDGFDDVVVGGNFGNAPGLVTVFDSRTGAMLSSFADASNTSDFGRAMLGAGDLDGDGRSEIVVTAPGTSSRGVEAGKVLVFSSRTGKPLYELRGERPRDGFGSTILVLPDWTRSHGRALAVGAASGGPTGGGYVRVFELRTGTPLQTFAATPVVQRFGYSLVDLGDRDRDGYREMAGLSLLHDGRVRCAAMTFADAFPAARRAPPK